ncbi:hypothetical protein [Aureibacillus halotolerans]|uniref:Uncharacterized protein n=1 Tax=Aureibacillus halotolerans TaxID=1508390 RepID=A0A4R6U9E8_9BACI|nr:hypothetical protein [Aureibacillus halotolerans]TDQ41603.1 hypothetical protein EV213_103182 [Aureibacillus halotolerans]
MVSSALEKTSAFSVKKSLGIGSFSLLVAAFAMVFNFYHLRNGSVGEYLLAPLGFSSPYIELVGIVLFCVAWYLGKTYKEQLFAKAGLFLARFVIGMYVFFAVIGITQRLFF